MVGKPERVFETARFAKASKKANITDDELCPAIRQVRLGRADDLAGGVFKKRLGKNLCRSLIPARGRQYWCKQSERWSVLLARAEASPAVLFTRICSPRRTGADQLIRESQQVSQPVFARYLNTSESTVEK